MTKEKKNWMGPKRLMGHIGLIGFMGLMSSQGVMAQEPESDSLRLEQMQEIVVKSVRASK